MKDLNDNLIESEAKEYKIEPVWINIIGFIYLHYVLITAAFIVGLNKTLLLGNF